MASRTHKYSLVMVSKDVFINCPLDSSYKPIFNATVFAISELGELIS